MTQPPDTPVQAEGIDDEALTWFVRRRERLTLEDEHAFAAWLARSPAHRDAYAAWDTEWEALAVVPAHARSTLAAQAACQPARPVQRTRRLMLGGALAASAAAVLAVRPMVSRDASPAAPQRHATAPGERRPVSLPDGSQIELDTATTLNIGLQGGLRRLALDRGQAWFDIRRDPSRPLDVVAGPAIVRVVGTQFTVRHLPGSQSGMVEVAVAQGSVRVGAASAHQGWWRWLPSAHADVALGAGQRVQVGADGRPGPVQPADLARVGLWREGRIALEDVTLADALAEFARHGHVVARLADARAAALRVSGVFDAARPAGFYRVLSQVLPVQVREDAQGFVIASTT